MANDKDKLFEKVYFMWKGTGEKNNQSIDFFCQRYGANVDEFNQWLKSISKTVKEVKVVGGPNETGSVELTPAEAMEKAKQREDEIRVITRKPQQGTLSVTITCASGLRITRKGMQYQEFLQLAQNLKALC